MSDNNNAKGSRAPEGDGNGGADDQSPPANDKPNDDNGKSVSYESYSRAVEREKRWKQEAEEARQKLNEYETAAQKAERERLEKEGNWQKLAETRAEEVERLKNEVQTWTDKFSGLNSQIQDSKKAHAVVSKLPGSLRQDYFHMLDLDGVVMNPETGEIDETTAVKAAESFAQRYPELIKAANSPRIPNGEPGGGGVTKLTYDEYLKLPHAEKRKALNEGRFRGGQSR